MISLSACAQDSDRGASSSLREASQQLRRLVSHLPGAVAALAAQVLPVGQQAGGARALEGQPRVDEGRGAAVVVHKERLREETAEARSESGTNACSAPTITTRPKCVTHLPSVVVLHLPAAGQLQLLV